VELQPYCGSAPVPAEIWSRWNFDYALLALLALFAAAHLLCLFGRSPEPPRRRIWLWAAGWITLVALFVSPLCALTSALFSARLAHHVVLMAVVPPILVLSFPSRWRTVNIPTGVIGAVLLVHIILVWFWHAPAPYAALLAGNTTYWIAELTLFGSALLLWYALLSIQVAPGIVLGTYLALIAQMGLLGAIITFARTPLYAAHFATTEPWGLTALADQQLAGLIMWVPANIPYLIAALALIGVRLSLASTTAVRNRTS
jgi:putative membrane protein